MGKGAAAERAKSFKKSVFNILEDEQVQLAATQFLMAKVKQAKGLEPRGPAKSALTTHLQFEDS